jgi:hypothetical protein
MGQYRKPANLDTIFSPSWNKSSAEWKVNAARQGMLDFLFQEGVPLAQINSHETESREGGALVALSFKGEEESYGVTTIDHSLKYTIVDCAAKAVAALSRRVSITREEALGIDVKVITMDKFRKGSSLPTEASVLIKGDSEKIFFAPHEDLEKLQESISGEEFYYFYSQTYIGKKIGEKFFYKG